MIRFRLLLLPAAMVLPGVAHADNGELWTGVGATGPVSGKLRASIDAITRIDRDGPYEAQVAIALGWRPSEHVTVWAGFLHKAIYANSPALEERLRQDVVLEDIARIGPVRIGGRLRAEEKWRGGAPGFGWRVRPQVKLTLPLKANGLSLFASGESFVNLGGGAGQKSGYDRTRAALGVTMPLGRKIRLDTGILRQWTRGADTADAATVMLSYRW